MDHRDTDRVVVGVGRSPGAYQALRYAVAEARKRSAPLVAVRAYISLAYSRGLLGDDPAWAAVGEADAAAASAAYAFTEALGGVPDDVPVEIVARNGTVAWVLVSEADRDGDLLVIGGCGAPRLTRPRPLAIAAYCLHHAVCPVVVVPPPAMARSAATHRLARALARDATAWDVDLRDAGDR
jgi:nucleotide-binding universal stress UspA family protein